MMRPFARLSLPAKFVFRATETRVAEVWFEWRLLRRKAEHLVVARPFSWQVGEPSSAYATG